MSYSFLPSNTCNYQFIFDANLPVEGEVLILVHKSQKINIHLNRHLLLVSVILGILLILLRLGKPRGSSRWFEYLKGTHEVLIHRNHPSSIVEFPTIIWSRKKGY